jgi:phospholipase/carboxylesterase
MIYKNNQFALKSVLNYICHGETKNPKYLAILLHGYGSNKENLITLAHHFFDCLAETLFIAVDAPFPLPQNFYNGGYQWFSIQITQNDKTFESSFSKSAPELKKSNQILSSFIDELLEKFNLKAKKLFLLGFSQGAMMSIYNSLTRQEEIGGVISYSGKVILPTALGADFGQEILSKPPICLFHGKKDPIVDYQNFIASKITLQNMQIPFEAHDFEDLEHHIISEEIELTKKFITKVKK